MSGSDPPAAPAMAAPGAAAAEPAAAAGPAGGGGGRSPAADSDSSEDGLPPMDAYWASMLNVSKVAEPLPPPKVWKQVAEELSRRGRGRGSDDGRGGCSGRSAFRGGRGYANSGSMPMGPGYPHSAGIGKGKSRKAPKGGLHSFQRLASDRVGDFVAWAKDPDAADGSRPPPRERSRSPRHVESGRLEDFMSWAKEQEAKQELRESMEDEAIAHFNSFMSWAADETGPDHESAESNHKFIQAKKQEEGDEYVHKEDINVTDNAKEDVDLNGLVLQEAVEADTANLCDADLKGLVLQECTGVAATNDSSASQPIHAEVKGADVLECKQQEDAAGPGPPLAEDRWHRKREEDSDTDG